MIGELIKKHNTQVNTLENEVQGLNTKIVELIESHKLIVEDIKAVARE